MSTVIRPEVSRRCKYWIERHRYYELKHFCLQYPIWQGHLRDLDGYGTSAGLSQTPDDGSVSDTTERTVELRELYTKHIEMVERTARDTDSELGGYILTAVTKGVNYEHMRLRYGLPCCRGRYYELYRRFFWLLDKARQ